MVYNVTAGTKDMDGDEAESNETDTFLEEAEGNEDSTQSSLNSLSMECASDHAHRVGFGEGSARTLGVRA